MTRCVADLYPARTDTNGITWYKAAVRDSSETWGWTSDPDQAHDDYKEN